MARPFPSEHPLLALIGHTPLVDLSASVPLDGVRLSAKLEMFNPGGSVKDRAARAIVEQSWPELSDGATLVDATSGNTGIAYAMLGAALEFDVRLFMPENASAERRTTLAGFGAQVTLTPGEEGQDGAIDRCRAFVDERKGTVVYADQYSNAANVRAHYETTGPELVEQTGGELTHFVAGVGTGGTVTGTGRYLHEHVAGVQVVGLQPAEPLHGLEGLKHLATSHVPTILDRSVQDAELTVGTLDAWAAARRLVREWGLAVGPSSGAAFAAALLVAEDLDTGHVVTIFPDGLARYGSTLYAEHIAEAP